MGGDGGFAVDCPHPVSHGDRPLPGRDSEQRLTVGTPWTEDADANVFLPRSRGGTPRALCTCLPSTCFAVETAGWPVRFGFSRGDAPLDLVLQPQPPEVHKGNLFFI